MSDDNDRQRITWTTRVSVVPSVRSQIERMSREERVPMAYLIGNALADYVRARSTE
jgi:hypothetical protein